MNTPKLPIDPSWIKHTLVPFLRYAFSHTLHYDADLTLQVEQAIAFCLVKPDYPTDGDDVLFERVFMAILHRYKDLAPELRFVTTDLNSLAKFLIRRAQLKGPFELLGRSSVAIAAWVEYERIRLACLKDEEDQRVKKVPHCLACSVVECAPESKVIPNEALIDPRLWNAQPGQYTAPELSASITPAEDEYYRRQNHMFEEFRMQKPVTPLWDQQFHTITVQPQIPISGGDLPYEHNLYHFSMGSQQQVPAYVPNFGQAPYQAQNGYHAALQGGNSQRYPQQVTRSQKSQQIPSNSTKLGTSAHASCSNPAQSNTIAYQPLPLHHRTSHSSPTIPPPRLISIHSSSPCTTTTRTNLPNHQNQNPLPVPTSTIPHPPNPQYPPYLDHHTHPLSTKMRQNSRPIEKITPLYHPNPRNKNKPTTAPLPQNSPYNPHTPAHPILPQGSSSPSSAARFKQARADINDGSSFTVAETGSEFALHPAFSNIVSWFPVVGFGGATREGGWEVCGGEYGVEMGREEE